MKAGAPARRIEKSDWMNRTITWYLGRSNAKIKRCCQERINSNKYQRQNGSGWPRVRVEREDREIVRAVVTTPDSSLSTIYRVAITQESNMTLCRWLRQQNFRWPLWSFPLTPVSRQVRLEWCRAHEELPWSVMSLVTSSVSNCVLTTTADVSEDVLGSGGRTCPKHRKPYKPTTRLYGQECHFLS